MKAFRCRQHYRQFTEVVMLSLVSRGNFIIFIVVAILTNYLRLLSISL